MKLIIYKTNYADEFDMKAVRLVAQWPTVEDLDPCSEANVETEVYFGTNEFVLITPRDVVEQATVIELNSEEAVFIAEQVQQWEELLDPVLELLE